MFSSVSAVRDGDRQNLRLQARALADLAWHASHESADAIARKLALGFLIEPLHLRDQAFKRPRRFLGFPIHAKLHRDRPVARAVNQRLLEIVRQIRERQELIDAEMFHQRALQVLVISLHRVLCRGATEQSRPQRSTSSDRRSSDRRRPLPGCPDRDRPGTRRSGY